MLINFFDRTMIIKIIEVILLSNIKILGAPIPIPIGVIEREEELKKKIFLYIVSAVTLIIRFSLITSLQFISAIVILFSIHQMVSAFKIDNKRVLLVSMFLSVFLNDIIWNAFDSILIYDIIIAVIKGVSVVLGYILFSNLRFLDENLTESDMLISVTFIGIMLMGIENISLFSLNIKNIISTIVIFMIAMSNGVRYSALSGIILGTLNELSNPNMGISIISLGLGGLISGLFKNKGKIYIVWGFLFGNSILAYYLTGYNSLVNHFLEIVIAGSIFYVLTQKELNRLKIFEPNENLLYAGPIIDETIEDLNNTSGTLYSISELIDDIDIDDERYDLFDEIKDDICFECDKYDECWDRNYDETMDKIFELIEVVDDSNNGVIRENILEDFCDNGDEILQKIRKRYSEYKIDKEKDRSNEIKNCVSEQFKGFSQYINNFKEKFLADNIGSLEEKIVNGFEKENYELEKVNVNISNEKCEVALRTNGAPHKVGFLIAANEILSKVLKRRMLASDERKEEVVFREYDKLYVDYYVATKKQENSIVLGDSYKIVDSENDKFMMLLSDGMGTGIEASRLSNSLVELFSEMSRMGLNPGVVTNMLGSFIQYISNTDKIVTLDTFSVDLLTGECELLKIGGAPTFILHKKEVEIIYCDSLPLGILDRVDFLEEKRNLEVGDIIVSVSDGVVDSKRDMINKEYWISSFLKHLEVDEPKIIAEELLNKTIENYNNVVKDDVTIIVSKICE